MSPVLILLTPEQRGLFRDVRTRKGLPVSGVPGVSAGTVHVIERGSRNRHRPATVGKLARALGITEGTLAAYGVRGFTAAGGAPDGGAGGGQHPPAAQGGADGADGAAAPGDPVAALLGLSDLGHGATLVIETESAAKRVACEIAHGKTAKECAALSDFLDKVARYVDNHRWPRTYNLGHD